MESETIELVARLADSFARSDAADARGWLRQPLLELLADGEPVTAEQLAVATGEPAERVTEAISDLPGVETDEKGRVVGYGLTLRPTEDRFEIDGKQLYAWCAADTLIYPIQLGRSARVASRCHATGAPVRVTVTPSEVANVEPSTAVISIVAPDDVTDVRAAFCNHVHFFASRRAAAGWLDEHPEGIVVTVRDAFDLAYANSSLLEGGGDSASC
jgi:alkylmercury lyase